MAFRDLKDLPRGTASDKLLCHRAFNNDWYQRGLA